MNDTKSWSKPLGETFQALGIYALADLVKFRFLWIVRYNDELDLTALERTKNADVGLKRSRVYLGW